FFFSSRRRHTRFSRDWSSDVCSSDLRHRFQTDTHGLARTWAGLRGVGDQLELDVDGHGSPLQLTIAAVYAAAQLTDDGVRHRTRSEERRVGQGGRPPVAQ